MLSPSTQRFAFYEPNTLLKVTGADAAVYLQGQFTNDLRTCAAGEGRYGLWLNQKGRVVADSFVSKKNVADEYLVSSYFSSAAVVRERLEAYVVADDVSIEDARSDWTAVSLLGEGDEKVAPPREAIHFHGRRRETGSVDWLFSREKKREIEAELRRSGAAEISPAELEFLRIEQGIPAIPRDIGPTELPNEGGLESMAISYTKGCYLGQEVMARLKSMGKIRRRLLRVKIISAQAPASPTALFLGDRQIGELRSTSTDQAGQTIGLALLSLMNLRPDARLAFAAGGEGSVQMLDPIPT